MGKHTNKNLDLFFTFIEKRYFPERVYSNGRLESYNIKDKKCIKEIKRYFEREERILPKIKQYNVKEYIKLLSEVIEKLESLEKSN